LETKPCNRGGRRFICLSTKAKAEPIEPIPVVHIPRKPHPNGLFIWLMGTKSTNTGLPYILDFERHLTHPQLSGRNALKKFLERWPYEYKPTFVADSKIGGFVLLNELSHLGYTGTFSCSSIEKPFLWEYLKQNLKPGNWRAAISPVSYIVSAMHGDSIFLYSIYNVNVC